jgi:chemotaxis methyl-accepting protein methylase
VVIQHLDPTQEGHTVELLQSHSTLPVAPITDQLAVRPGQVYVLPAGQQVTLEQGYLRLVPPAEPRGLRLPIDTFFRSLAAERQHEATGVVLSGMGADGTLGLRAIREVAGATFAQAPEEARFDAMPRSAIDAGVVDVVAAAAELPARIRGYLEHRPGAGPAAPRLGDRDAATIDRMLALLHGHTGRDFTQYKRSTIQRRIERRMGIHQRRLPEEYLALLADNPQELDLLFRELLIGVTSFFRDPALWEQLATVVIPALLAGKPDRGTVRAWVAGCSTGEEAYSLAIVLREALLARQPRPNLSIQVFATDLDEDAIRKARAGTYPAGIAADVSAGRLEQFFIREDGGYRVRPEVRESVVFAVQDVVADPPFIKLDLLSCRNVLIYLDAPLQRKMMTMFHYALRPGGMLVLGTAETTGTATALFAPADAKLRIYRRLEGARAPDVLDFPGTASRAARGAAAAGEPPPAGVRTVPNLEQLADRLILQEFAPAAVLCTPRGDLLYISGRTGRFLEPAAGKANLNLLAMAREGLRDPLAEALRAAMASGEAVRRADLPVDSSPGALRATVTVRRLAEPGALSGLLLVVFAEAAARAEAAAGGAPAAVEGGGDAAARRRLEADLLRAQELVKRLRDEMQTSQEELRTANEELQSTNEELQSTNEELTTSKEEMQSMNEELQTVNTELLARVDELSRASSDMRNLLNSTSIATLFLDAKLQVRRFTPAMTSIVKLIPGDVGRPITDLVLSLDYPALAADVRDVLQTLIFREVQVRASDDRWFTVRIMPYQGHDQRIDGVVITFLDNTALKRLELGLRQLLADVRPPQGAPAADGTVARIEALLRETMDRMGPRTPRGGGT